MKWILYILIFSCTFVFGVLSHVYVNTSNLNDAFHELLDNNLSNLQNLHVPDSFADWYNGEAIAEFIVQNVPLQFDVFVSYVYEPNNFIRKFTSAEISNFIKDCYYVTFFFERIIASKLNQSIATKLDYYLVIANNKKIFLILASEKQIIAVADITTSFDATASMGKTYAQSQF